MANKRPPDLRLPAKKIERKAQLHYLGICHRVNIPIRCTITRQVPRFGISAGTGVRQRPLRCLPSGSIAGGGARSPSQAFITSDSNGDLGSPTSVFQIWSRPRVQLKIIHRSTRRESLSLLPTRRHLRGEVG